MTAPIKLKWLIAHQPAYLFVRTAKAFTKELEKRLPGQFEIEVLTVKEYVYKYGDIPALANRVAGVKGLESNEVLDWGNEVEWTSIKDKWTAFFEGLTEQKIHLSQTQASTIGFQYPAFNTLDLPFLFEGHDHVSKVLDGEIGDELCEGLGQATGVKGLAFTYSGGFRVLGANQKIENLDDIKNANLTTVNYTTPMFKQITPNATNRMNAPLQDINDAASENGVVETTYLRFKGTDILKTNHSMFLTTILMSGSFFDTLTEEQQQAFKDSAKVVAKLERNWSVEDAEVYEKTAKMHGITINEISEEDTAKLRANAQYSYKLAEEKVPNGAELIARIKNAK